jgi:uncharacterized damage-inducible protein DinB
MFEKLVSAIEQLRAEAANTQKIMDALTDQSLNQAVTTEHRTLGRIAWHIVVCIPEMMNMVGLNIKSVGKDDPIPPTASEIADGYRKASDEFLAQLVDNWNDATLQEKDDLYGETWKRGKTLMVVMIHEIHHRGQMTVLMRQAGLKVPGTYGPSKEEWSSYGAPAPEL